MLEGPAGPRVSIIIQLRNSAPGHADASDGSQYNLMDAVTEKFAPVFKQDERLMWQLEPSAWKILCSEKTKSYAEWRFYADLNRSAYRSEDLARMPSLIPGGSTDEFLHLAFGAATRALPVELAGGEYTWKQDPDEPSKEGRRVVWLLSRPEGIQGALGSARRYLGGGPA